jgi:hypothetical protein
VLAARLQQPHHHHRHRRHIPDRFSASAKSPPPRPRSDGRAHSAHGRTTAALFTQIILMSLFQPNFAKLCGIGSYVPKGQRILQIFPKPDVGHLKSRI